MEEKFPVDRRTPTNLELLQAIESLDKRVGKLEGKWNILMGVIAVLAAIVFPLADMLSHWVIR